MMSPFIFNPNQDKLFYKMSDQLRVERKIRIIDLKSRRVGVSSMTDAVLWCYNLAFPNRNSKIVAHLAASSEELFRVPSDMSKAFPSFAHEDIQNKRIYFDHKNGQSQLSIATAGTPAAGRGGTLSALHLCLRGDSLISSVDGKLMRIDSLRNGDLVYTHNGNLAPVSFISSRTDDRRIVEVRTWLNHETVTMTEDHKVFTSRGWIRAGELTKEDNIGVSLRKFSNRIGFIELPEIRDVWGRRKRGKSGGKVTLNQEFGFFCGYYIAEGSISTNKSGASAVCLGHHKNENHFAARASLAVRDVSSSYRTKHLDGNRAVTSVHGSALSRWVEKELGRKDLKRIPEWIYETNQEFAQGVVLGYLAGDGSKGVSIKKTYECPTIYATSVRRGIIYQLRHLLGALGIGWGGIIYEDGFVDKRGWKNRPSWTISISGAGARSIRSLLNLQNVTHFKNSQRATKYHLTDSHVWIKVKSIKESNADSVWDIEVDHPDHSFETVIGCVANSECAFYPDDDSFTSMITSVSKGDGSIVLLESTANGREGPGEGFAEFWDNAVAGRNGYIPVFLSWLDDPACIRSAEEADDAPIDDLEKELMSKPFCASREQIAWMRRTKADDCHDMEPKWLQEYPHTPSVAFQVSGSPAFARDELAYGESTIRPPLARGKLVRSQFGKVSFVRDDNGPLFVWEFPDDESGRPKEFKYYIGADAALGTESGDFACYVCFNGSTGEFACRFAERITPEVLADQLDMAGRWYHTAMVNPELTGNLGRWTLIKLRDKYFYPNIYAWKGRDDHKRGKSKSMALGFEMTSATRRLIIDAMRSRMRMGMRREPGGMSINDRMLQSQMSLATLKEWRWEVERGHDDVLVATAISVLTAEQYPPPRMKFRSKIISEDSNNEILANIGLPVKTEMQQIIEKDMQSVWKLSRTRNRDRLRGI